MSEGILSVEGLIKLYGDRLVIDGLSHRFGPGFHGITGPNGAGKSTLLAILAGAEPFQSGSVRFGSAALGDQPDKYRPLAGYAPDRLQFYPFLRVREFWLMAATARRVEPPGAGHPLVEGFGLDAELDTRLDALSLGTRKKVLLISALLHSPQLLLLDEPTDELDANSKRFLIDWLEAREGGVTLIATHDDELLTRLQAEVLPLDG